MYEKIFLSDNVFIEYDIDENQYINKNSLHIVNDGKIDPKVNNGYNRGILACLIEYSKSGKEGPTLEEIAERAWPDSKFFDSDFKYERNVPDKISKLKNALSNIIGVEKANIFLPRRRPGFYFTIQIPKSTIETSLNSTITEEQISFKTLTELNTMGFTNLELAKRLVQNDIELFGFPEGSPEEGNALSWSRFMDEDPVGWGFIVDEKINIVGNYSSVILSDTQRDMLFQGTLNDGEIDLDSTVSFDPGYDHTLYILNISVNPSHNTPQNRKLLFNNFFNMILEQAKEGIFFKEIYFNSWRMRKALYSYGFKRIERIPERKGGGVVIGIENFPSELCWDRADELIELYNTNKRKLR